MKVKIIQQIPSLNTYGGIASEFKALQKSNLNKKYEFIPMELPKVHRKISLKDIKYYYNFIKNEQPDIVQVRGVGLDGLNAQIAAKFVPNTKILLCVHAMMSEIWYKKNLKIFFYKHLIEPICFKLSDGISCVYENGSKRLQFNRYRNKMLPFVYNRMPDYSNLNIQEKRKNTRLELDILCQDMVGIYCGRITDGKGLIYLMDAFIMMKDNWPEEFKFIFVGDGEEIETLKKIVITEHLDGKIKFVGAVQDVPKYLSAADFFVLPSLYENHSIALLEALSMKLPIITTNVGGNAEIVRDEIEGLLCQPASSKELYDALNKMINDKSSFSRYKENILKNDYIQFSNYEVDKQLDAVYTKILSSK